LPLVLKVVRKTNYEKCSEDSVNQLSIDDE